MINAEVEQSRRNFKMQSSRAKPATSPTNLPVTKGTNMSVDSMPVQESSFPADVSSMTMSPRTRAKLVGSASIPGLRTSASVPHLSQSAHISSRDDQQTSPPTIDPTTMSSPRIQAILSAQRRSMAKTTIGGSHTLAMSGETSPGREYDPYSLLAPMQTALSPSVPRPVVPSLPSGFPNGRQSSVSPPPRSPIVRAPNATSGLRPTISVPLLQRSKDRASLSPLRATAPEPANYSHRSGQAVTPPRARWTGAMNTSGAWPNPRATVATAAVTTTPTVAPSGVSTGMTRMLSATNIAPVPACVMDNLSPQQVAQSRPRSMTPTPAGGPVQLIAPHPGANPAPSMQGPYMAMLRPGSTLVQPSRGSTPARAQLWQGGVLFPMQTHSVSDMQ